MEPVPAAPAPGRLPSRWRSSTTSTPTKDGPRGNEAWISALRGDGEDHAPAIRDLEGRLQAVLRRVVGMHGGAPDLADLVQESLVRILERLDSFRGDSAFTTWAIGVAIRVALTELRRRRGRGLERDWRAVARIDALETPDHAAEDPAASVGRSELLAALHRAIRERLTEKQRTAILAELRGVPSVEIAERLHTNRNALYKLVHDARKRLRQALVNEGYTAEAIRAHVEEASR